MSETMLKIYPNGYLNDCHYCIYFSLCYGISGMSGRKGKLAEKGCIITGWEKAK